MTALVAVKNKLSVEPVIVASNVPRDDAENISPYCERYTVVPLCTRLSSMTWYEEPEVICT